MTEILICEYSNYSIRRLHRIGQYSFYWKVISIPSLLFGKAGYEVLVCVITAPSIRFFEPCLVTVAMLDHFFFGASVHNCIICWHYFYGMEPASSTFLNFLQPCIQVSLLPVQLQVHCYTFKPTLEDCSPSRNN